MERLKKFKSFKINEDIFGTFSFYNVKNHVNNIIKMMGDNEGGITYRKISDNFYKQDGSLFGKVNREKLQKLTYDITSELEEMGYIVDIYGPYGLEFDVNFLPFTIIPK